MQIDELKNLAKMREKITNIEEKLRYLNYKNTAPKNQILSAMPKSSNFGGNSFDEYLAKKEYYQNKVKRYYSIIKRLWKKIYQKLKNADFTDVEIYLIKYRFYYNYSWETCIRKMRKKYPEIKWSENRIFAKYRVIKSKLNKVC